MSKLSRMARTGLAIVSATAAGAIGFEVGGLGGQALCSDAEFAAKMATYKRKPVLVKKGRFSRPQLVVVNPATGAMSPYSGNEKASNKKPIKLY